jgi:hypothetical protein
MPTSLKSYSPLQFNVFLENANPMRDLTFGWLIVPIKSTILPLAVSKIYPSSGFLRFLISLYLFIASESLSVLIPTSFTLPFLVANRWNICGLSNWALDPGIT